MKQILLTLLLLFAATSVRAEASIVAPTEQPPYTFTAADGDLGSAIVRSVEGLELLYELTHRAKTRTLEGQARGPRPPREITPLDAQLQLAIHSSRAALARETVLLCAESPFIVYLPYHANPPPRRS